MNNIQDVNLPVSGGREPIPIFLLVFLGLKGGRAHRPHVGRYAPEESSVELLNGGRVPPFRSLKCLVISVLYTHDNKSHINNYFNINTTLLCL